MRIGRGWRGLSLGPLLEFAVLELAALELAALEFVALELVAIESAVHGCAGRLLGGNCVCAKWYDHGAWHFV